MFMRQQEPYMRRGCHAISVPCQRCDYHCSFRIAHEACVRCTFYAARVSARRVLQLFVPPSHVREMPRRARTMSDARKEERQRRHCAMCMARKQAARSVCAEIAAAEVARHARQHVCKIRAQHARSDALRRENGAARAPLPRWRRQRGNI